MAKMQIYPDDTRGAAREREKRSARELKRFARFDTDSLAARISPLRLLRSAQRRGVGRQDERERERGGRAEGKGHVETSECLVRGASDCQFIVRIIACNRAALFGGRVMPGPSCVVFL